MDPLYWQAFDERGWQVAPVPVDELQFITDLQTHVREASERRAPLADDVAAAEAILAPRIEDVRSVVAGFAPHSQLNDALGEAMHHDWMHPEPNQVNMLSDWQDLNG